MSSLLERGIKVLELLAGHPEGLALSAVASAGNLPLSATLTPQRNIIKELRPASARHV